jgi:GT2 family glycosyltransferase
MTERMECVPNGAAVNLLIVILCYRVVELTVDCLRSLAGQIGDVPGTRVVICENGTGPEAVEQLRQAVVANGWEGWVNLKAIKPNVGFTGGNNAVLRDAMSWAIPPKYFLLLNADTIVQAGALKALYDGIEKSPETGIIGPMLIGTDGSRQVSCFRDHSPLSEFLRGAETGFVNRVMLRDSFQLAPAASRADFDWISFACAIIRSDVVRKIGFLDEGFFLYYDDNDYCRTARNAGWRIGCCPEARVVHLEGQSNELPEKARARERKPRYYYVSRARYFAKHFGTPGLWAANVAWSAGWLISEMKRLVKHGRPSASQGEWRDIWTNAWAPMRKSNASLRPSESHIVL